MASVNAHRGAALRPLSASPKHTPCTSTPPLVCLPEVTHSPHQQSLHRDTTLLPSSIPPSPLRKRSSEPHFCSSQNGHRRRHAHATHERCPMDLDLSATKSDSGGAQKGGNGGGGTYSNSGHFSDPQLTLGSRESRSSLDSAEEAMEFIAGIGPLCVEEDSGRGSSSSGSSTHIGTPRIPRDAAPRTVTMVAAVAASPAMAPPPPIAASAAVGGYWRRLAPGETAKTLSRGRSRSSCISGASSSPTPSLASPTIQCEDATSTVTANKRRSYSAINHTQQQEGGDIQVSNAAAPADSAPTKSPVTATVQPISPRRPRAWCSRTRSWRAKKSSATTTTAQPVANTAITTTTTVCVLPPFSSSTAGATSLGCLTSSCSAPSSTQPYSALNGSAEARGNAAVADLRIASPRKSNALSPNTGQDTDTTTSSLYAKNNCLHNADADYDRSDSERDARQSAGHWSVVPRLRGVNELLLSGSGAELFREALGGLQVWNTPLRLELHQNSAGGTYMVKAADPLTGGTDVLRRGNGPTVLGIFKPRDEEIGQDGNPHGNCESDRVEAFAPGSGSRREVLAYRLDHGRRAGVPATVEVATMYNTNTLTVRPSEGASADADGDAMMGDQTATAAQTDFSTHATCGASRVADASYTEDISPLHCATLDDTPMLLQAAVPAVHSVAKAEEEEKRTTSTAAQIGSLQQFLPGCVEAADVLPGRFDVAEVHALAIFDIRTLNGDRHGGNVLVQNYQGRRAQAQQLGATGSAGTGAGLHLIPIDHSYICPSGYADPDYEWLSWPQAKLPFSEEELAYIAALDAKADAEIVRSALLAHTTAQGMAQVSSSSPQQQHLSSLQACPFPQKAADDATKGKAAASLHDWCELRHCAVCNEGAARTEHAIAAPFAFNGQQWQDTIHGDASTFAESVAALPAGIDDGVRHACAVAQSCGVELSGYYGPRSTTSQAPYTSYTRAEGSSAISTGIAFSDGESVTGLAGVCVGGGEAMQNWTDYMIYSPVRAQAPWTQRMAQSAGRKTSPQPAPPPLPAIAVDDAVEAQLVGVEEKAIPSSFLGDVWTTSSTDALQCAGGISPLPTNTTIMTVGGEEAATTTALRDSPTSTTANSVPNLSFSVFDVRTGGGETEPGPVATYDREAANAAAEVMRCTTRLLQIAALEFGMTAYAIGSLCRRPRVTQASLLESVMEETRDELTWEVVPARFDAQVRQRLREGAS